MHIALKTAHECTLHIVHCTCITVLIDNIAHCNDLLSKNVDANPYENENIVMFELRANVTVSFNFSGSGLFSLWSITSICKFFFQNLIQKQFSRQNTFLKFFDKKNTVA